MPHASDKESNCLIFLELTDVQPTIAAGQQVDHAHAYYQLSIEQENIYLRAPSIEGIHHALCSLKQLIEKHNSPSEDGKIYLPICLVENTYELSGTSHYTITKDGNVTQGESDAFSSEGRLESRFD